ncbi:hypothetical protein [Streptomyces sp. NPDC046976]|uniref:hypothetical protein n=1 Tax=Streptomyces sp. NPDC046976 TaxID=3155258 RepID=UPI0033E1A522
MSTAHATFMQAQVDTAIHDGFEMAASEAGVDVDNRDFVETQAAFWAYLQLAQGHGAEAVYTREQVSAALNLAVDDMAEQLHGGTADDIDNFAVNAALTLLETPGASFEDITVECYGEDAAEVSRWLTQAA